MRGGGSNVGVSMESDVIVVPPLDRVLTTGSSDFPIAAEYSYCNSIMRCILDFQSIVPSPPPSSVVGLGGVAGDMERPASIFSDPQNHTQTQLPTVGGRDVFVLFFESAFFVHQLPSSQLCFGDT